jgi:regulator of protease activity HflC (stomatin/prohibitin superfamily)
MLVQVEELEMGVVFGRRAETFKRFLEEPGWYILSPFDHLRSTLNLGFQVATGTTKGARTAEGLPVTLEWWLSYQLKPLSLPDYMRPGMSRALAQFAEGMVKNHGINCLQLVVEQCSVEDLCRPGIQQQLEQAFKERLAERLKIFGIEVARAMVHSIELPREVVTAMEEAHEREVHSHSEAEALERLHEVISKFDDKHMARLAELERMRLLGKNGVSLVYPMTTVMEGKQQNPNP